MPAGMLNLFELKKIEQGIGYDIIEENIAVAPELRVVPAEKIFGTEVKLTVRTDLPTVGFRKLNSGTPRSSSKYEVRTFETAKLDHQAAVDVALVDDTPEPARVLSNHMSGVVEAQFRLFGKQFYYGLNNDANGFPGLIAQFMGTADFEVDATDTGSKSSVWFVRIAPECLYVLAGRNTTLSMDEEWKQETIYDAQNNPFQAYTNWLKGALGVRLANRKAAVRIKNIGTTTNKTLTDKLMFQALQKFTDNAGADPTHIFMTGRSLEQLRSSRTPTNADGKPAPMPADFVGIPIIRTSSISNSETI